MTDRGQDEVSANLPRISGGAVVDLVEANAWIIDLRPTTESARGTLPGAINIPLQKSLVSYAPSVLPHGPDLYLLAESEADAFTAQQHLESFGFDKVCGWMGPGALAVWEGAGRALSVLPTVSASDAVANVAQWEVVDVRSASEAAEGSIEGSTNLPVGEIDHAAAALSSDKPLLVHCGGGTRCSIAASILRRQGFTNVATLEGGYAAYEAAKADADDNPTL